MLSGCGSDGPVAQPEDDFLDQVEAACRTAKREADKLDLSAEGSDSADSYVDIIKTVHDDIEDLEPPTSMKKDFDNLVGDLDDQVSQGRTVIAAIDSFDSTAISDEVAALAALTIETDNAAKALGALRCRNIADVSVIGLGASIDTVPDQTIPIDTTPDTADTTPDTADTTPDTTVDTTTDTATDDTSAAAIYPNDLNLTAIAPAGFTWSDDFVQSDAARLYAKPDIGPIITDYSVGQLYNDATGNGAGVYVMTIAGEFTGEVLDQYLTWEVLDGGTDATTPGGRPIVVQVAAFDDTDCIGFVSGSRGVSICTSMGVDGASILDAYVDANPA